MIKYPRTNNGVSLKSGNMQVQPIKNLNILPLTPNPVLSNDDTTITVDSSIRTKSSNRRTITQYEELSNVSEERPEILAISSFNPLYDEFGNKTENGDLFDVYIESLKQIDSSSRKLLKDLDDKEFVKNKNHQFKKEITNLREKLSMLNSLLKMLSLAGTNLNLHNKIYEFSPVEFVEKSFNDDSHKTKKINLSSIAKNLPEKLNLDVILSDIKTLPQNASLKYSSSKLWILAIHELRNLLFSHSKNLLNENNQKNTDDNFSTLPNDGFFRLDLEKFKTAIGNINISPSTQPVVQNSSQPDMGLNMGVINSSMASSIGSINKAMGSIDYLLNMIKDDESKTALIFHLITKELRHSLCFDSESQALKTFRGPGTSPITSKNFFDSVFGIYPANKDIFQKSPDFTAVNSSLMDLCYSRDLSNQNRAVLNLEEKEPIHISNELVVGSKYFFDAETIFTNVVGQTINIERIDNFQRLLSRLDNNFFDIMSNFGLLPTDDSAFVAQQQDANEQSQKPEVVSLDPVAFFENVMSYIVDENGMSKIYQFNPNDSTGIYFFKQSDRGVAAMFSLAAQENDFGRSVRSLLFFLINDIAKSGEDVEIDKALFNTLRSGGFEKNQDVESKIDTLKHNLDEYIKNQFNVYSSMSTDAALVEITKNLRGMYENAKAAPWESYVPCKFDNAQYLGQVIRSNSFIKDLAKIMKEFKDAYVKYACKGGSNSKFQQVSVDTMMLLFFNGICRMISSFSDNTVVSISIDDTTGGESIQAGGNDAVGTNALNILGFAKYGLVLYVNVESTPKSIIKKQISSYIQKELKTLLNVSFGVLNTLDVLSSNIKTIDSAIKKFSSEAIGYLLRYLNNDAKKLSLVLKEPQLMLMLSTVEDTFQSFKSFSDDDKEPEEEDLFTNYIENISYYPKMTENFELLFKDNKEFTTKKGYNKKILSVGIPQGLFERLLKTSSRNTKNSKHDDIFKVCVYKTDLLNGDIIYRPKIFLFEASRFPIRNYGSLRRTRNSDYHEIFKAVPTRNYSLFTDIKSIDTGNPEYWDDKSNAFGAEYSFLSRDEKNEIIENHVTSFLLENYLKIVTGMTFNDVNFNLDSREVEALLGLMNDETLKEKINKTFNVLENRKIKNSNNVSKSISNVLGVGGKNLYSNQVSSSTNTTSISSNQNNTKFFKASASSNVGMLSFPRSVNAASEIFQNPDAYISKILQPKKFDRVFNIIFDPEFQVDYEKTISTTLGAQKFDFLLKQEKFIQYNNTKNEYVDSDKSPNDTSLENFFISIETHAEEYVLPLSVKKSASSFETTIKANLVSNTTKNVYRK